MEIRGHRPTFCSPYQSTPNPSIGNFSMALDQAIAVLNDGTADLAGITPCTITSEPVTKDPTHHSFGAFPVVISFRPHRLRTVHRCGLLLAGIVCLGHSSELHNAAELIKMSHERAEGTLY